MEGVMPKEVTVDTVGEMKVTVGWSKDNESVQIGVGPVDAAEDGSIESGWYATLGYDEINRLNENLTKAQHSAYGLENSLRILPYEAPGRREGEPAYDFAGLQLLKSVVDSWSDEEIVARMVRDRIYAVEHLGNYKVQRVATKSANLLGSVLSIRKKTLDTN